jgi:glucokinase
MQDGAILVGDAGGTNVRFALAHVAAGRIRLSDIWKRPGADYPDFTSAIDAWLTETKPKFAGAAFGLAGQLKDGRVELLNRGWTVDVAALTSKLGLGNIVAVNDFFAMARSAPDLAGDQLREISPGEADPQGSLAIGGPGTGFGIAILRRYSGGWIVVGGEGGHQAYAPQTDIEWRVFERLQQSLGYVSNEIVAAGAGFEVTLASLAEAMGAVPPKLSQPEVMERAKAGDPLCLEFCRLRARCVMTAMGNMALVANATGGVFLAGGVGMRLEPWLKERAALDRFYARGARTGLIRPIPISLIVSEEAPLTGAAMLWLDQEKREWL